jgi:hypothetical protein
VPRGQDQRLPLLSMRVVPLAVVPVELALPVGLVPVPAAAPALADVPESTGMPAAVVPEDELPLMLLLSVPVLVPVELQAARPSAISPPISTC